MTTAGDFTKMVPGFDFLQGLMKNAGSALPGMGQWIAPTLNPEELEKRIEELRTVQFWLEQNARMLAATIQALEVQRMTLSTLKTMNVPVAEMAEAFKIKTPAAADQAPAAAPAAPTRAAPKAPAPSGGEPAPGIVDPMQWWGALTKQFTELAARTLRDAAPDAAKGAAGPAAQPSTAPSRRTAKKAGGSAAKAAPATARTARAKRTR